MKSTMQMKEKSMEGMQPIQDFGYVNGIAQEERITELSEDQEKAIEYCREFVTNGTGRHKVIGGVAGSGKSTIIPYIISLFGQAYNASSGIGNVAVCAYTGKAVMNLKRKGITDACTLHSFLYDTKYVFDEETGGKKMIHIPRPDFFFNTIRLLIVDEASMVNREMYNFIESLPFKTIYIGDHFQLPPVNDTFNIMLNPNFKLERIHRQEEGNPIVMLADMARHGKALPLGVFGDSKHTRTLEKGDLIEYDEIITWTNAVKDRANELIREKRGFQKDVPQMDDKMIVRVNNRNKNVYNGQIVYLMNHPTMRRNGGWNVEFVDELAYNDPFIMAQTDAATKAIASVHLPKEELDRIRSLPFANKTVADIAKMKKGNPYQIHLDWGYAITCHAAQGTSWANVAVLLEDRMKSVLDRNEWSRWLYTAVTRAEKTVTIYSGDFRNL